MSSPSIHDWLLPYTSHLESRALEDVDLVVMHCTELPDLATAREYSEKIHYESGTGNSGHYYIDRDGSIHRFVPEARVAHHVHGFNARSIGIELVNTGRYPHWLDSRHQAMHETYPDTQIESLCALLHDLCERLPGLRRIAGHEDLDTRTVAASNDGAHSVPRKRDPGPLFPWARVLDNTPLQRLTSGRR